MSTIVPAGLPSLEALYFEMDQLEDQNRQAARATRHAAEDSQVHALLDQADHVRAGALMQGMAQCAVGASTLLGTTAEAFARGAPDASTAAPEAPRPTGLGAAVEALGQVGSGILSAVSGAEDAAAQRLAARATAAGAAASDARDVEEDATKAQEQLGRHLETAQQIQRELAGALVRV